MIFLCFTNVGINLNGGILFLFFLVKSQKSKAKSRMSKVKSQKSKVKSQSRKSKVECRKSNVERRTKITCPGRFSFWRLTKMWSAGKCSGSIKAARRIVQKFREEILFNTAQGNLKDWKIQPDPRRLAKIKNTIALWGQIHRKSCGRPDHRRNFRNRTECRIWCGR